MFKATEVERKIRNKSTSRHANNSLCAELQIIFSRCLSYDCHGTCQEQKMYHLGVRKIFGIETNHGGRKDGVEITSCISS